MDTPVAEGNRQVDRTGEETQETSYQQWSSADRMSSVTGSVLIQTRRRFLVFNAAARSFRRSASLSTRRHPLSVTSPHQQTCVSDTPAAVFAYVIGVA